MHIPSNTRVVWVVVRWCSIIKYVAERNLATVELQGARLEVDTRLLGNFGAKLECLYQFIGELSSNKV